MKRLFSRKSSKWNLPDILQEDKVKKNTMLLMDAPPESWGISSLLADMSKNGKMRGPPLKNFLLKES